MCSCSAPASASAASRSDRMFQSTCARASTVRASRSFAHALSCSIAWVGGASSLQGDAGSRGESKYVLLRLHADSCRGGALHRLM